MVNVCVYRVYVREGGEDVEIFPKLGLITKCMHDFLVIHVLSSYEIKIHVDTI